MVEEKDQKRLALNGYSFILAITKELSMVRSRFLFKYEIIVPSWRPADWKRNSIDADRGGNRIKFCPSENQVLQEEVNEGIGCGFWWS